MVRLNAADSSYRLIIFDWDGTLCASLDRIVAAMQEASRQLGWPVPSVSSVKEVIGLGLSQALSQIFGELMPDQIDSLMHTYREVFASLDTEPAPLYEGVPQVLNALQQSGYLMAIATGKSRQGLDRSVARLNVADYFSTSCCADESRSKPAPDMLNTILSTLGVEVTQALMIGDTEFDLAMAKSIGMDRVGVSYGSHGAERLLDYQPLAVIHQMSDLLKILPAR